MTDLTDTTELIQRGKTAARVGRLDEAREYLGRAVERAPDNVEAWLALAAVEQDPNGKIACFETILGLDPDNVEARLGLEMLQEDAETEAQPELSAENELETVIAQASRRLEEAVGPPPPGEVPLDDGVLTCANHPSVETMLRCNRCGKPICTRCTVQTPVGYRCKECVGQQQSAFYTGGAIDYAIGSVISLVLGGIAGYIMTLLGAWFFALILGPAIGIGIAEAVRLAVRRRRSRYLWMVVAGGIIVGTLPALLIALNSLWALLALGLFLVLAVGAATARLR
ncbi:MAG TPA: tetratricopeptide repeat protein [Anaerolineae bacterium]|nr:tetratricopeptide repeat protein [Anaerolineae bacterium]